MRQFEWDSSLEEFCASEEEIQALKKVASLLCNMPEARSSSSFQSELKARLLEKALAEEAVSPRKNKRWHFVNHFMKGLFKYGGKMRLVPSLVAAAAFLMVISLLVFYQQGLIQPYPLKITLPEKSPGLIISRHPGEIQEIHGENYAPAPDFKPEEAPSLESENDDPLRAANLPENTVTPPDSPPGNEPSEVKPLQPEEAGTAEDNLRKPLLKDEPEFEALKNQQSFQLAGTIMLPPVYYRVEQEGGAPAENVSCSWNPRKIVFSSAAGDARIFGTEAWARETLSNNGFIVRDGDYLEVKLQETKKGLYAELFYRPQQSPGQSLTMVFHCQEEAGIIAYYYKEEGEIAPPGFYPLLSPAEAFKYAEALKWFAPSESFNFSFQEVFLTYGDFLVEENGRQQRVKLPAYSFLGMETIHNGGELRLILPAVK